VRVKKQHFCASHLFRSNEILVIIDREKLWLGSASIRTRSGGRGKVYLRVIKRGKSVKKGRSCE
jgi:hypothetical protein